MKKLYTFLATLLIAINCHSQQSKFKAKYIIVLVVDGPRYCETWGDSTKKLIPNFTKMAKFGTVSENFHNDQFTYTSSGHTALATGHYQEMENVKGTQLPDCPSYLQYYLQSRKLDSSRAWIITSKDKLAILGNTVNKEWHDKFRPSLNCGVNGWGTGYRQDTITYNRVISVLSSVHPDLLFVNFREPDWSGHRKDWNGYLKGIKDTDSLVFSIWQFIQNDSVYAGKTALFVTNDHGRHNDNWKEGFAEHGDHCSGCMNINLYAFGPDFKSNYITKKYRNQTDLTATIAYMLDLKMPYCAGKPMKEIFK